MEHQSPVGIRLALEPSDSLRGDPRTERMPWPPRQVMVCYHNADWPLDLTNLLTLAFGEVRAQYATQPSGSVRLVIL